MCTFHFLQHRWTWLHDDGNRNLNKDRILLIQKVKELVYAKSVSELTDKYQQFLKLPEVVKNPKFSHHMQSLWSCRSEWAHCYHAVKLVQGNHTNNYTKAGMSILKELIFGCVKAYNIIQNVSVCYRNYGEILSKHAS